MPHVYRPTVKRKLPNGTIVRSKSKRWYVGYERNGVRHRVAGYIDKAATMALAAKFQHWVDMGCVGVHPMHQHEPLATHVTAYREHMIAQNLDATHIQIVSYSLNRTIKSCGFQTPASISPARLTEYLAHRRATGTSIRTSNYQLSAMKAFCNWLVRDRRIAENPLAWLKELNTATDIRRKRLPLTPDQLQSLVSTAAAAEGRLYGLPGPDRAMLYLVAANTGLRRSELASLKPESFADGVVVVQAAHSKHRREDVLPLPTDLAEWMKPWLAAKPRGKLLWPPRGDGMKKSDRGWIETQPKDGGWAKDANAAKMLRHDLAAASIPDHDDTGRIDFHALRHTFISNLARAGVHPKVAQELARHANINLTMNAYTHLNLHDLQEAVDRLPMAIPQRGPKGLQKLGQIVLDVAREDCDGKVSELAAHAKKTWKLTDGEWTAVLHECKRLLGESA